jgi:hypothetical protein
VADVVKTCANCGNAQTTGDFCEKCGTRMPAAAPAPVTPTPPAAAAAAAYSAPRPPTPPSAAPSGYAPQPQYGAAPPPQYAYSQERVGWSRLFNFSFQGFVTSSTLKTLYVINLALIGLYVLFNIIYVAMAGNRFSVIAFFISLFAAGFWFFLSRIIFELMATAMRIRDKIDG